MNNLKPIKLLARAKAIHDLSMKLLAHVDFLVPLALRIYLVPVFWFAGINKAISFEATVAWFGNPEWGLGLPFSWLNAAMAISAELAGAVALAIGLGTRLATVPMMFTMIVALLTVHGKHGWQVIHDPLSPWASPKAAEAVERLAKAKSILKEHGNYQWLTEFGNFVISNNGAEWVVTYFIMLFTLFFLGGGRFVSADYWISRSVKKLTLRLQ